LVSACFGKQVCFLTSSHLHTKKNLRTHGANKAKKQNIHVDDANSATLKEHKHVALAKSTSKGGTNMITIMFSTAAQCFGKLQLDRFIKCMAE